ncbi:MAG TPA: RNA polymerase sigma factor [Candidatus Polarisedimenticolia bacterium]|nr:RNA polymerase sigma factor [Candidatus Polarisedimenticolia bacterium]
MGDATGGETLDGLVKRCRDGDSAAFAELYRKVGGPLYGTALRMLRRPQDAEDAVQDTFLALHRDRPDIPGHQLPAWLHRVLVNQCLDRLRRRKRWQESEVNETVMGAAARDEGAQLDLRKAVELLPERARLVFLLHDVEGFKHREISEMLGTNTGTTKSQLFRARGMLRDAMTRAPRDARGGRPAPARGDA